MRSTLVPLAHAVIGHRRDGRPIYLIQGGAEDGGSAEGGDGGQDGGDKAGQQQAKVVPPGAKVAGQDPAGDEDGDEPQSVDKLPKWAQRHIEKLRDADVKGRQKVADLNQRQKDILKAAGIDTDEQDPEKVRALLEQERDAARKDARDTKVELAVFRLASPAGADPNALLDSRSFMAKLDKVDENDSDEVKTLITDWVKDNPKFKTTAAGRPGNTASDHAGGTGEQVKAKTPQSLSDAFAGHYGTGN